MTTAKRAVLVYVTPSGEQTHITVLEMVVVHAKQYLRSAGTPVTAVVRLRRKQQPEGDE